MARSRSRSPSRSRRRRHSKPSRYDRYEHSSRRRSRSRSKRKEDSDSAAEETNGEVSLSIDETNKLRVSLGLKPLAMGPSEKEKAVVNMQKSSAQLDAEREQLELQKKLQQSRTRRELTQKLVGQSLGEQLTANLETKKQGKINDLLEWVKESRKKVIQSEETTQDQSYDASALAGMTVGHALETFNDGEEVILTLKDQRVLVEDGKGINEQDDELVNVELSEKDRRLAQQTRAKRAVMPAYSGYDDDEFITMGSMKKKKTGTKLLAQYDEEQDAAKAEESKKFKLDESGGTKILEKTNNVDDDEGEIVVSLALDRTKRVEEYYSKEEVETQFAKKSKKLRKKKKSRRRRDILEDNETEEVQLTPGTDEIGGKSAELLISQLEQEALESENGVLKDRGRRKCNRSDEEEAESDEKLVRFQEAREKANAAASEALAANLNNKRIKRRPIDDSDVMDDGAAIELELGASLARARQLVQQQTKKTTVTPMNSEARIAHLVSQTISQEVETTPAIITESSNVLESASTDVKPVGQIFGMSGAKSNTVVFNDATDFETRLRDAMEKRAAQFQGGAESSTVPTSVATEQPKQTVEEHKEEEEKEEDQSKDEEAIENEVWGEEQPLVGTGMGATLALLRKTGDLRQTRVERQAGRANDARDHHFEDDLRIKNGVKLDYRDEFGRLLTKKEAFRMLSYKFHGQEPGKKKKREETTTAKGGA